MLLTLATVTTLAASCAPSVAPSTLAAVAQVESGFDSLAIGVNGADRQQFHPTSQAEAVTIASRLIAAGRNIDLGLGQINSANLGRLGLSVARAFDACANLEASGRLLQSGYATVRRRADNDQAALRTSLSLYNTGDVRRGFRNGYVVKVLAAAAEQPALLVASSNAEADSAPPSPAWDVFARVRSDRPAFLVFTSAAFGETP